MATVTVVSDTDDIYPLAHVRDASNIPYVLAVDASDNLVLYEGNAAEPTSFSTTTVASAANWTKSIVNAYMIIGVYSTIEYIWVFYIDSSADLHVQRAPVSTLSFSDQGALIASTGYVSAHYDNTNERIVVGFSPDTKAMSIMVSEDGGANWGSEIEIFDFGSTNYCRASAVVWDGDYIHIVTAMGSARTGLSKRYNYSTSTLEYYNTGTPAWETCSDSDTGFSFGTNNVGGRLHGSIGTNIMVFADGTYNLYDTGAVFSRSSTLGESFSSFPNHGSDADMGNSGCHILKTEVGEVDDIINVAGYNFSSSYEDVYIQTYDYSASSWSGMSQLEGYSAGYVRYFASEKKQRNGWAALSYSRFDGTSTYYVLYRHMETGTGGATTLTKTFTVDAYLKQTNVGKTFTVDGYLKQVAVEKTLTADAYFKQLAVEKTFTVDGYLKALGLEKTFTVDAYLRALGLEKDFTVDAFLHAIGLEKTMTVDAYLKQIGVEKTYTVDALLKQLNVTQTMTVDAFLKQLGVEKSLTVDAYLKREGIEKTFTVDAWIKLRGIKTLTVDAFFKQLGVEKTLTVDAFLHAIALEKTFTVDALLKQLGREKTFTVDAFLIYTLEKTFTVDAYLKQLAKPKTMTVDAFLKQVAIEKSMTVDAYLKQLGIEKSMTVDAYLKQLAAEKTFTVDAWLKGLGFEKTFTVDAILVTSETLKTFTVDAFFKQLGVEKSMTVDALFKQVEVTQTFTVDAYLKQLGIEKTFTTDAYLKQLAAEKSFTVDSYLKQLGALKTFTTDAYLKQLGITKTFTVDAILFESGTKSKSFSVDAIFVRFKIPAVRRGAAHTRIPSIVLPKVNIGERDVGERPT